MHGPPPPARRPRPIPALTPGRPSRAPLGRPRLEAGRPRPSGPPRAGPPAPTRPASRPRTWPCVRRARPARGSTELVGPSAPSRCSGASRCSDASHGRAVGPSRGWTVSSFPALAPGPTRPSAGPGSSPSEHRRHPCPRSRPFRRSGRSGATHRSEGGRPWAHATGGPGPGRAERGPRGPLSIGEIRRRPTLPGNLFPSTIGAGGLNCRVRNGNGCDPAALATETCCQRVAPRRRRPREDSTASTNVFVLNPSPRPISTGRLNTLPCVHLRPINVVVWPRALPGCPSG